MKVELDLSCAKDCVLIDHHNDTTGVNSVITSTKIYVIVVTFSINDNTKFLEILKQGYKRTISWNKNKSEVTTHPKTTN